MNPKHSRMQAPHEVALLDKAYPTRAGELIPDAMAETSYARMTSSEHRKELGQFFTPPRLAALMADWVGGAQPKTIIDPALGTGILTRAMLMRCPSADITAFEIDRHVLKHADVGQPERVRVRLENFLLADFELCDGIIMNPPYIRHRELEGYDEARSRLSVKAGFVIPKSANLYVYFVVKACLQLRTGGRGAFLIPSEWLNANFSTTLKRYLLSDGGLSELVLFSGCSTIFQDALTTASVLLIEKKS